MTADRLPLRGKRILITRAREQSSRLQQLLELQGAEVIAIPSVEILPPNSYDSLDTALRNIAAYDWLVLTSANSLHALTTRALLLGVPVDALTSIPIAAIGNATAEAVREAGLTVALIPPHAVAESLAEALTPFVAGKRVALVRASVARDVLPQALRAAGASVTIAEAYQTVVPAQSVEALQQAFCREIDAITFTSGSSVLNFHELVRRAGIQVPDAALKISIGPITSRALIENGWAPAVEASTASMDALVAAVVSVFTRRETAFDLGKDS